MKLILYYFCGLALAWMGINSLMVGLAYWESSDGSLAPIVGGLLMLALAARFILQLLRIYLPPPGEERELED